MFFWLGNCWIYEMGWLEISAISGRHTNEINAQNCWHVSIILTKSSFLCVCSLVWRGRLLGSGIAKIVERSRLVVRTLSSKLDFCTFPSHLWNLNRTISLKAARDVKIQNGYLQTLTYVTHPSQTTLLLS